MIEARKARSAERCEFNLNGDNTLMALTTSAASDSLFNFIPFPSNESSGLLEPALSALSVAAFWPEINRYHLQNDQSLIVERSKVASSYFLPLNRHESRKFVSKKYTFVKSKQKYSVEILFEYQSRLVG